MYRPKKRKYVRRAVVSSSLALVAITGLGVTILSQGGATSTALKVNPTATIASTPTTSKGVVSTASLSVPRYHIVGARHDDSQRSGDD